MSERRWKHRSGDQYVVMATSVVGNPDSGYEFVHEVYPQIHSSLPNAKRHGFTIGRSDDFNIGVLRDGKLVAVLWMDKVVDDEWDVLADYEQSLAAAGIR